MDAPDSPQNPFESPSAQSTPTIAAEVVPRQTTWPAVLGILGIVLGIFGLLGGLFGIASNLFLDLMPKMPGGQSNPMMSVAQDYQVLNVAIAAANSLLAIWLLISGMMIMKRRPAARGVVLAWAAFKVVAVIVAVVGGYFVQTATIEAMLKSQTAMGPAADVAIPAMWAGIIVGTVFAVLWGLALPVFVLVWFNRAKVKAEIAAW